MKTKNLMTTVIAVVCALFFIQLIPSRAMAQATVATDQADYPPGGTVYITGGGFATNEIVQLQVLHIVNGTNDNSTSPAHQPWEVTADADGNFTSSWY